jgi:hypothetical protein
MATSSVPVAEQKPNPLVKRVCHHAEPLLAGLNYCWKCLAQERDPKDTSQASLWWHSYKYHQAEPVEWLWDEVSQSWRMIPTGIPL